MEKEKTNAAKWLGFAVLFMLISMIGASLVQTSGGEIKIKDLRFEAANGRYISALLLIPPNATAGNPAPAVVASHGMHNSKEAQDISWVELSRRGYVVLAYDMINHGWSQNEPVNAFTDTNGMYEAVQMLTKLDYVDSGRIGITGHSMGGMSIDATIRKDNEAGERLVSAAFFVAGPADYTSQPWFVPSNGVYEDIYGDRDVGLLGNQYDEFFWRSKRADGSSAAARDFIETLDAQSILYHGVNAAEAGLEYRKANTIYHDNVNGKDSIRVIYTPPLTHRLAHFTTLASSRMTEFFEEALGAPNPIAAGKQIWPLKQFFNMIGLISFFVFMVNVTLVLLKTNFFSSLRSPKPVQPLPVAKGGEKIFFGTLAFSALVSVIFYLPIVGAVMKMPANNFIIKVMPFAIGCWAAFNGIVAIIVMAVVNKVYIKKSGISIAERGLTLTGGQLFKTLLLGVVVVSLTYFTVFFADYFFKTDFRVFIFDIKTFPPAELLYVIPTFILMLIYYVPMSVSVNCFNYNTIGKGWINTALLALSNMIGLFIMRVIQYIVFYSSGAPAFPNSGVNNPMYVLWLFPTTVILIIATVVSRKIYRESRNPYIAGFVNAAIVSIITVTNCMIVVAS
ncbi:hypothetical protein FACS189498_3520 [Spirochaetia bacterium]|nr:hypothetical protein FACS189498_3520 [Spirochaetia bacterium]